MAYTLVLGGGAESTSNLWVEPDSPHAYDDEFDGSTMDDWSVQNLDDATAGSITLDAVDHYDTTFNSGDASVYTNVDGPIDDAVVYPYEYVALHKVGGTYHYYIGSTAGTWSWFGSQSSIGFTPDYVGFELRNTSTSAPGVAVVGVDFIRFFETATFTL